MDQQTHSFDPDTVLKRITTWIFGSAVGVFLATMILSAAGTTPQGNLPLWVLCAGGGPLVISVVMLRRNPRDFGFALPQGRWIRDILIVLAFTIPLMVGVAKLPVFESYYTVHYVSFRSALWGLVGQTAIYYFFEEFLFHGFMFFGLLRKVGKTWSTVAVSVLFTIMHIGKPLPELLLAIIYSVIFCWLSYRSKSFFSAAIVHFTMSLVVNVLVAYVWLGPAATTVKF
jgi:membrane protease YdiL (CAAX protease family)